MARATQNDIQKKWERRIERALKRKEEDFDKPFKVQLGRDYFEGKQNPGWPADEWITVNKIYSHMREQLPSLYSIDPYFYVKLGKSYVPDPVQIVEFEKRGKIRQSYLNYLKRELKLKSTARLGIQDAHFAFGVAKIHYSVEMVENPDKGKPIQDDDGIEMVDPDSGEFMLEPEALPVNERYNVTRVHPDDIVFDEDAGPLDDKWCFIAERIILTKDQAKKNKWINQTALKDAPTRVKDKSQEKRGIFSRIFSKPDPENVDPDKEVYMGWEIYDLENDQWLMIVEGANTPVKMPGPLPPGTEDHPYCFLRFVLRDKSAYPIPPVSQSLDPQKEFGMARSRVMTHRKRFNRKYVMNWSAFEDPQAEATKLEFGGDGTVLIARTNADQAVSPIQDAQLDQSSYMEINALANDVTEMMGGSGFRNLPRTDSATEAALIDKRTEVTEGDMLSLVVDWISEIAEKLDQLVQAHITKDEAIQVAGPSGEFWELVRSDDYEKINGQFEYSVNTGATMPRLPQIERSQWMAFLQVLAGFPHLMTSKRFMMHMAELHHIEDEAMVDDLMRIGQQILGGQAPMPGGSGSQAGQSENNPITAMLGAALGDQGGAVNGGGDASLASVQ